MARPDPHRLFLFDLGPILKDFNGAIFAVYGGENWRGGMNSRSPGPGRR